MTDEARRIEELEAALAAKDAEFREYETRAEAMYAETWAECQGWKARGESAESSLASLKREMESVSNRYAEACIDRNQAEAELAAERARFDWWFGPAAKDINEYLRGVREGWSIEQWRAWIDAARSKGSTEVCQSCDEPATKHDVEGVPLCDGCYDELKVQTARIQGSTEAGREQR